MIKLTLAKHPDEEFFLDEKEIVALHQKVANDKSLIIRTDAITQNQTIVSLRNTQQMIVLERAEDIAKMIGLND